MRKNLKTGIYKIQSVLKPDRFYIGSSYDVFHRKNMHFYDLKENKHHTSRLQNHYNKYGKTDLVFSIILECEKDNLLIEEQKFLDSLNPFFNICKIAGSSIGVIRSEESKLKMSAAKKKMTDETKQKLREASLGRPSAKKGIPISEEQKQVLREVNLGKRHTDEAKLKISIARKGVLKSEKTKKRMSEAQKNLSPDTKLKIRLSVKNLPMSEKKRQALERLQKSNIGRLSPLKGIPVSEERKQNLKKARLGKRHTEETKLKMSESRKKYHLTLQKNKDE